MDTIIQPTVTAVLNSDGTVDIETTSKVKINPADLISQANDLKNQIDKFNEARINELATFKANYDANVEMKNTRWDNVIDPIRKQLDIANGQLDQMAKAGVDVATMKQTPINLVV